ncbi:hypothetical protein ANN_08823 [Periplaneta americana]|uniref:Transposase n=1 Tax=Periplaneta americana TaxID=6978 RepID=A0ABQ8T460_PERAM|nr:hypothetical protein ANN_08823 [Periplaneta americana]
MKILGNAQKLPPNSLTVTDNVPYQCKVDTSYYSNKERTHTELASNEWDILQYFDEEGRTHGTYKNPSSSPNLQNRTLFRKHGHKVVRLPPYHCDLNTIQHTWTFKKKGSRKNVLVSQSAKQIGKLTVEL